MVESKGWRFGVAWTNAIWCNGHTKATICRSLTPTATNLLDSSI